MSFAGPAERIRGGLTAVLTGCLSGGNTPLKDRADVA
jgi:hypothetical protein